MRPMPDATCPPGTSRASAAGPARRRAERRGGPPRSAPRLLPALLAALSLFASSGCVVVGTEGPVAGGDAGPAGEPPAASSEEAPRAMEREIFERVNDERRERGLAPVAWDDRLAELARDWSREMADTGQLRHQDLQGALQGGEVEGYASLGENVFSGTGTGSVTAGRIHAGWMRSEGHRGNVLEPGWDRLGVGVVCAEDGSVWATQEFGRTRGADRPPLARETPPEEPIVRSEPDGPSC